MIIFLCADKASSCIGSWYSPDIDERFSICLVSKDSLLLFEWHIYETIIGLVVALNIIFGLIFSAKLTDLVGLRPASFRQKSIETSSTRKCSENGASTPRANQSKLKALVVKNNILTFTGKNALVSYFHFFRFKYAMNHFDE